MTNTRRKLLTTSTGLLVIMATACDRPRGKSSASKDLYSDYGDGFTLVVDAVPGAEMLGVEFFAEADDNKRFYAKSRMVQSNRAILGLTGKIPNTVRITWREKDLAVDRPGKSGIYYDSPIIGDYTIPVGSRIPQELFTELRKNGGGLRLKFRLKPDGVLFGWDIIREAPERKNYSRKEIERERLYFPAVYAMVGGDFLDTFY